MVLEGVPFRMYMNHPLPTDEDGNIIVRIGHSPSDDAFMFHAMTNNKFPTPDTNLYISSKILRR